MAKTYPRWQSDIIKQSLKTRRVLVLAGPRQCGKTTLARGLAWPETIYRTLDDVTLLSAALSDPKGFIHHNNELMIIDEVQKAPLLLQAVKQDVDTHEQPGRFLLTGSANIRSLPGVTESMAGRISKIRLRPLALGEIHGNPARFVTRAFKGDFIPHTLGTDGKIITYDKNTYLSLAFHGGYPEALRLDSEKEKHNWHQDYLEALIERDLQNITRIKRQDKMFKLVEILAAWSSKFMDIPSICKNLSVSRSTLEAYINALEALYLVERLRPWHKTDYDRIGKQEKLFMCDTGMMTAALNWRFEKVRFDGDMNGKLIETFVFNQLTAILDAEDNHYSLTHYRDREQREVDFIIENSDGHIMGIEVKAGSVINRDMFNHLTWFQNRIVPQKEFIGVVLYTGENVVSFGNKLWAVPICCLWS